MTKIIVVTSGKGGVGKTTTSASFSAGLALRGHKTAVIDFDVGLRNLDLIMGCERRVVYDLINVIHGEANLNQALIKDKQCDNLFVLAASQTRDKDALTQDGVERVLTDLAAMGFEYIVCDSPAGIETGALMAMHYADEALVVTNPEVSSVRDSDRILGMLGSKTKRAIEGGEPIKEHLLITRYNPSRVQDGQMLSLEDIQDILRIKLIGVIPESENVLTASNQGMPAVHLKGTDVSEAYKDVIDRFLGEDKPLRFVEVGVAIGLMGRVVAPVALVHEVAIDAGVDLHVITRCGVHRLFLANAVDDRVLLVEPRRCAGVNPLCKDTMRQPAKRSATRDSNCGVRLISGTITSACAVGSASSISCTQRRYTSVLPLPVAP